tara:strand:+ start:9777 stop:10145 length:369 start_codon:yes stop_codon:yes gene_type:complete
MHFVYFLRSESDTSKVYTGETADLDRRLGEHNSDDNAGYTRRYRPWRIEACVVCDTKETAVIVEVYFKNNAGQEKFNNFALANPHHPSPKQGFFDTLKEGRAFGRGGRRFRMGDGRAFVMVN